MSAPANGEVRLFVYGTLLSDGGAAERLSGCTPLGEARVRGTLFDIEGRFPALMLAGGDRVSGEVWSCPWERIHELDGYEAVDSGLFRRIGVEIDGRGCWTYVAGPALAARLSPDRRIASGRWRPRGTEEE